MGAPHWGGAEGTRRLFDIAVGKKKRKKKAEQPFRYNVCFLFFNSKQLWNKLISRKLNVLQLQRVLGTDYLHKFVQTNKFSRSWVSSPEAAIIHLQPELRTCSRTTTHTLYMEVWRELLILVPVHIYFGNQSRGLQQREDHSVYVETSVGKCVIPILASF